MLKTTRLLCITVSVGRSRSVNNAADTKTAFCCARACKKQVPAFFKAHLYSNAQKALQESDGPETIMTLRTHKSPLPCLAGAENI